MAKKYFVSKDEQSLGPFTIEEIGKMIKSQDLSVIDYIYDEDQEDWCSLMQFEAVQEFLAKKKPKIKPVAEKISPDKTEITDIKGKLVQTKDPEKQEWYVLKGEKKYGPFTYTDIVRMLQEKSIFEFDYIWQKKMDSWQRIAETDCFSKEQIKKLQKDHTSDSEVFFRRRHSRANIGSSIIVHDNQKVWKGKGIEISEGGCGLEINNSMLLPGNKIFIHFKPAEDLPSFNAVCEIVSKKFVKNIKAENTPIRYGVKFISIESEVKKDIRKIIKSKAA